MRNIIEPFVFRVLLNSDVIAKDENKENMDVISKYQILGLVLSAIIIQLLRLLLGKWLWNTYLVKIVSGVKPLENIGQLIIISILLKILIT